MVPCGIFHMVVVSATAQTTLVMTLVELAAEQGRPDPPLSRS